MDLSATILRPLDKDLEREARQRIQIAGQQSGQLVEVQNDHDYSLGYGRANVLIRIRRETTTEEIRKATPIALALRDWLEAEGLLALYNEEHVICDELEYDLQQIEKEGMSYRDLAHHINGTLLHYLTSPQLTRDIGFAHLTLQIYGIEGEKADRIIDDALKNIEQGLPPFEKDQPITRDFIINVLRRWRNSPLRQLYNRVKNEQKKHEGANPSSIEDQGDS